MGLGLAKTVMIFSIESIPNALVTTSFIFFGPALLKLVEAMAEVADEGVPFSNDQKNWVGLLMLLFVKVTVSPMQACKTGKVKSAVGFMVG